MDIATSLKKFLADPVNDNYNYPLTTIINAQLLLITFLFFIIIVTPYGNGNCKLIHVVNEN
jgi:hypothetical protein